MPLIVVTSQEPGAGKTGVAAALARHYAYQGIPVRLARVGDDEHAADDARYFASLDFVPGSAQEPVAAGEAKDPGAGNLLVVEAPYGSEVAGGSVVHVAREEAPAEDTISGAAAVVVTAVPQHKLASMPEEIGGVPVVSLAEDRRLAGFSIAEAQRMLNAEVVVEGDVDHEQTTCDYLVVAPIGSDAGQPYFRRFTNQAVVVRFDKTDQHLAAMAANPVCLILSGGREPSGYLYDAATAKGVPVLLSMTDTENTVLALEDIWDETVFRGEVKLDRMAELLEATRLFETLKVPQPA